MLVTLWHLLVLLVTLVWHLLLQAVLKPGVLQPEALELVLVLELELLLQLLLQMEMSTLWEPRCKRPTLLA